MCIKTLAVLRGEEMEITGNVSRSAGENLPSWQIKYQLFRPTSKMYQLYVDKCTPRIKIENLWVLLNVFGDLLRGLHHSLRVLPRGIPRSSGRLSQWIIIEISHSISKHSKMFFNDEEAIENTEVKQRLCGLIVHSFFKTTLSRTQLQALPL